MKNQNKETSEIDKFESVSSALANSNQAVQAADLESSESPKFKIKVSKVLIPFVFVILSFVIGLIFFLPINELARESIKLLQQKGLDIIVADIHASLLGDINLKKIEFHPIENISMKIGQFNLDAKKFALLFDDRLNSVATIKNLELQVHKVSLKRGEIKLTTNIQNITKKENLWKGKASLEASFMKLLYKGALPIPLPIDENLAILIQKALLRFSLNKGYLYFAAGCCQIVTDMAMISIQGDLKYFGAGQLNLKVIIEPTEKFYSLSEGIKELLITMNTLKENRIVLEVKGSLKHPSIAPVN